jgi:glutaredoxin-related protein
VREEYFYSIREELLSVIYSICSNLPCPDCATHASEYLNSIQYKQIQSKEQLKNVLFQFHNNVNIRKNIPIFPRDQLEQKYQSIPLISTIYIFMEHFQDKHKSIRMISNDFYRARLSDNLKTWFNTNITKFNL